MSTKFSPTPAELALVSQIFAQADPQKLGILTGDVAVKTFGGANLTPTVLGEIWSIADEDNNGWLPRKGVAIAIRLMGWAQKGEKVSQELVHKPGPLPTIDGVTPIAQQSTGISLPKSPPPSLPPFTAQQRTKFQTLFTRAGPGPDGLLSAAKARDIFVKSKLSNDTLLKIWNLADTQGRGALDSTDFAVGMYFIQGLMSGQLSFVPTTLPPGLYQQATGQSPNHQINVKSHMTGSGATSGSFSPSSSIFPANRSNMQPQHTGQSQLLQPDYTGLSVTPSKPPVLPARSASVGFPVAPFIPPRNGHPPPWDVSPSEKAASDRFFDELDPQRRGYIEGDVAVPFMLKSNLPGEDLARVWDLADLNNDGKLTGDGFAVAMYLIQKKLAGIDIPDTLPHSLIPPSMRANMASPFSPPSSARPQPPESVKDLLWDETPPNSAIPPQPTGQTITSSFSAPHISPRSTGDPFATAVSVSGVAPRRDLLGDDDDEGHTSPSLHDQSAEIGNMQNQLNSTTRSTDAMKTERMTLEQALANQASQLSALQTQLSSAKAACETETKVLSTLKDRQARQTAEIQKATEELIRAESDLSAVRVEKYEIESAFMRDKEDARELHRKMMEVIQQVEGLKVEAEKVKKDAKQQKGLLAIAKKQLSSKEAEKAKVVNELEEAKLEIASIDKDKEEVEAELAALSSQDLPRATSSDSLTLAAAQPLPVSPDPSSPGGSITAGKSNNPFERLSRAPSTPKSQSPFLPFAPTPTSLSDASVHNNLSDPFGFAEAVGSESQPLDVIFNTSSVNEEPLREPTPKPAPIEVRSTGEPEIIFSASTFEGDNEHFVTPPTSAFHEGSIASSPIPISSTASPPTEFPGLDDLASKFPDIQPNKDKMIYPPLASKGQSEEVETDLGASLEELEVEESDSDSEDEVPLAQLTKQKANDDQQPPRPIETPPTSSEAPSISFDDIFGVTAPAAVSVNGSAGGRDIADSPPPTDQGPKSPSNTTIPTEPPVAGVSAFDEAMGTLPISSSAAPQTFTFDSTFEDNFDFVSASKPPAAAAAAPPNEPVKNEDFDNLFSAPTKSDNSAFVSPYEAAPPVVASTSKPTFDEVFSGVEAGLSQDIDRSFTSTRSSTNTTSNQQALPSSPASQAAPPTSPRSLTPHSPTARPKSPPPRVSSPKPRPSTSSSKEPSDKPKEITPRHSKLSIRLPFGRKKKQQQQHEPLPSTLLAPPPETPKPAVDEDIESVKQLTAMGFSRSEAVSALENTGYDMTTALNSLLG